MHPYLQPANSPYRATTYGRVLHQGSRHGCEVYTYQNSNIDIVASIVRMDLLKISLFYLIQQTQTIVYNLHV